MALWCIRPKIRTTVLEKKAFENGIIFIGWEEIPDLSKIKNKEELIDLYIKKFPRVSEGAVIQSGVLWRFSHNIEKNDIVVLSLSNKSKVAICEVIAPYEYRVNLGKYYRHIISVRWIDKEVPRRAFDKDLQYSFRSLSQVFQVRRIDAEKRVLMTCYLKGKNKEQN